MIAGLQTQRSPYQSLDNRYNTKFLGGKPDALLAGQNVEISNSLTLRRRPGLSAFGPSIDPPNAFYEWEITTTGDIIIVVDTQGSSQNAGAINSAYGQVLRYSSSYAGVYFNKAQGSKQANVLNIVNTLYIGDQVDLFKIIGPNLLHQSNTFGTGSGTDFSIQSPWTETDVYSLTPGQTDPLGGSTATQIVWSTTGSAVKIQQVVVPNYTPIANNTFTFSVWIKGSSTTTVELGILDQSGTIATTTCNLTTAWQRFQVTGTMGGSSDEILVKIFTPNSVNAIYLYGAQLEVGGPATTAQITTTQPQGVYLWGIQGPTGAPTISAESITNGTWSGVPAAWEPNTSYSLGQVIVDSNGDLEVVTAAGTSGGSQPTWAGLGGTTTDGASTSIVQTNTGFALASTLSVPYLANVTADNTLFAFVFGDVPSSSVTVALSDSNTNMWTQVARAVAGDQHCYLYASTVGASKAGASTVTVTFSSPAATGIWMAIAEFEGLSAYETDGTNSARDIVSAIFTTGVVTTTYATAFLLTCATFSNNIGPGQEVGSQPAGFQSLGYITGTQTRSSGGGHYLTAGMSCEFLSSIQTINPAWTIASPQAANSLTGITAAYTTSTGTLQWENVGPVWYDASTGITYNAGLTPEIGYTYYYAFMNSHTGHVSNVSVASVPTGAADITTNTLVAQIFEVSGVGMQITPGPVGPVYGGSTGFATLYDEDPQVDTIAIFRNTDGGGFFYQIAQIPNPGTTSEAGTWTLNDVAPDDGLTVPTTYILNGGSPVLTTEALNTEIYAPIADLNSPPPAGMSDMDYFAGRMFGSGEGFVYYNTAQDNASLLSITQNGVPAESWYPDNYIPMNASVTRLAAVGGGIFCSTVLDSWFITGQNLLTGGFNPQKVLINHGLRSWNALGLDGSTIYMYTADRQFLCINPNSGSVEFGFPIGDTLQATFSPLNAYVTRHVAGSTDNAIFLADGAYQWYRLNPNQQGASMSGEQSPVWSPQANFTETIGGIGAIASIETTPGTIQLLVGQTTNGPILVRNLAVFSDDDTPYSWSATIGSIVLTPPGKLAETDSITVELNANLGATQCTVSVLLEEIAGNFELLPAMVNDPPQLNPSESVLSERFYLSQGGVSPTCRHMQIQLNSGTVSGLQQTTQDELLALTIRGCLVSEQV